MGTHPDVDLPVPAPANGVFGEDTPAGSFGPQLYPDSCAIRCQEYVIERFTLHPVDEKDLVKEAATLGWYTEEKPGRPGGTPLLSVGNLLDYHGIPTNRYFHANVFNLTAELAQGHKVILSVDAEVLRHPVGSAIRHALGLEHGDHAVIVSGIDTTDPDDVTVIVSDPATGEAAVRYPMNDFVDAWSTSDFFMVATREPAPAWLPEMANFDYEAGHLSEVAGMPYDEFLQMEDEPEALAAHLDENTSFAFHHDGAPDHDAGDPTAPSDHAPPAEPALDAGDGGPGDGTGEDDSGGDLAPGDPDSGTLDVGNLDPGNLDPGNLDPGGLDLGGLDLGGLGLGGLGLDGGVPGESADHDPFGVRETVLDDPYGVRHETEGHHAGPDEDPLPGDPDPFAGDPGDGFPF